MAVLTFLVDIDDSKLPADIESRMTRLGNAVSAAVAADLGVVSQLKAATVHRTEATAATDVTDAESDNEPQTSKAREAKGHDPQAPKHHGFLHRGDAKSE